MAEQNRKTGRTTRIVDDIIQHLFNDEEVTVTDHYNSRQADEYLLNIILRRLSIEHPQDYKKLVIDKRNYIKLRLNKDDEIKPSLIDKLNSLNKEELQALKLCYEKEQGSVSLIQRRLRLSYLKSNNFIDKFHQLGFISEYNGAKPRKILIHKNMMLKAIENTLNNYDKE